MDPEVIPAILVKDRKELLCRIALVIEHVSAIHIDIMDGRFVPNKTIGPEGLTELPPANYFLHWMVDDPETQILKVPGPHLHLVHVETLGSIDAVAASVRKAGGRLGLAINPDTPLERLLPFIPLAEQVLVMSVRPGFSGQEYLPSVEEKVRRLRKSCPSLNIEIDGGINKKTISRAYASGANILAAASAIFASGNVESNIAGLKKAALAGGIA